MKFNLELKNLFCFFMGILFIFLMWQIFSEKFSGLVIASPKDTFYSVMNLFTDKNFITMHFLASLKRIFASMVLAVLAGGVLGIAAGLFKPVKFFLEPLRWMLMTIPGVVVVIVFMLWFGMGDLMIISLACSMTAPVIFINVSDAVSGVDHKLLEMAEIYKFSFPMVILKIYAKAVAGPFFSGVIIAAGNGIRVVVLGEVLGGKNGLGYFLSISRTNLDTPEIYALALLSMSIVGLMEVLVFKPLGRKFVWRNS